MEEQRWYIIGCYLEPGDGVKIREVEAAMAERPRGEELIIAGDFNVDMEGTDGQVREEEIAAAIAMAGLEYLVGHFL